MNVAATLARPATDTRNWRFRMPLHGTALERFWARVDKEGPIPDHRPDLGPCWLWTGYLSPKGYGYFWDQKSKKTHTFSYVQEHGPVPDGLELDHLCRVRSCCRPSHLQAVSHLVNMQRSSRATQTHCKRGHEFNESNTRLDRKGRACRECDRLRCLAAYQYKRPRIVPGGVQ